MKIRLNSHGCKFNNKFVEQGDSMRVMIKQKLPPSLCK